MFEAAASHDKQRSPHAAEWFGYGAYYVVFIGLMLTDDRQCISVC